MPSFADVVIQALDVKETNGDEVLALCPFHADSNPSFRVNLKKGVFICYSCGAKGGRSALMTRLGVVARGPRTDPATLRGRVMDMRSQAPVGRSKAIGISEAVLTSFRAIQTDYWTHRGFSPEVVERFDLGYDLSTDAATIPMRDVDGTLITIIRRMLKTDARPKYKYTKGFPMSRYLWGAHEIEAGKGSEVAICEGPLDAVALWDADIPAVALLGCQMSRAQEQALLKLGIRKVTLFMDNDRAGREASEKIAARLNRISVVREVAYVGDSAKDPGELKPKSRKVMYDSALRRLDRISNDR